METDNAQRYRSRILREMNANRANPFNSPPSSTGSHGTVSPTVSSVFSDPDGESTRRLHEDIARVTARKLPVNYEAAHRKWPDFFSMPKNRDAQHTFEQDEEAAKQTNRHTSTKENKTPAFSVKFADDSTQDIWPGSNKTRAEMQPRVDEDSDLSSLIAKSPPRSKTHRGTAKKTHPSTPHPKSAHAQPSQRRPSISDAPDRLRRASLSPSADDDQRRRMRESDSPALSSAKSSLTAVPPSPQSFASPDARNTSQARSFVMPDVTHLGDFVTGTLKFSGSMKNGVPIFVKNGRVHDRRERPSTDAHADVAAVEVPQVEEKIFVSMDMIRDEIVSLQEHHDKLQDHAESLQQKVERLEAELKSKKATSNGMQYEYPNEKLMSRNHELEIEVTSLQSRLEKTQQIMSEREMENVSLAHERDRAVNRLQSACDDISKLTRKLNGKQKELESSHKQLETTDQMRQDNDTLRRDLISLKQGRDALETDNKSLRDENETLRKEVQQLKKELESLRSENNSLRKGDDSLGSENRSLRSSNKLLMDENEDLRDNLDGAQHELDAAREEVDTLRQRIQNMGQEKTTLQQDNESLVRHNDKYFSENKTLRRENSGFERSIQDLHEENLKLRDEIEFLKEQLDHCRPIPKDDFSARLDEETEENMTSAFFVPDITINTNESGQGEATETRELPALPDLTSQSHKTSASRNETHKTTTSRNETRHETRDATRQDVRDATRREVQQSKIKISKTKNAPAKVPQQAHKVAFSVPAPAKAQKEKPLANKGSKRRNLSKGVSEPVITLFQDAEDTTGAQSVDNTTQDQATVSLNLSVKNSRDPPRHRDTTAQSLKLEQSKSSIKTAQKLVVETDITSETRRRIGEMGSSCPALSIDARRILDGLCEHNCRNCIVCSRITSHRGVITAAETASGKKRIAISRPVPVTDREVLDENATVRPSQSPGHALALVIKGLEDEGRHMQLELSRLQAQYNSSDKSLGRKERLSLAEGIRMLLKRLEVKNDQIYSLYDVLEGQKVAGQAMSEEEVEMTVLNITGMTVRDVTGGSEQFTWEGIQDEA
ncbi:hypothetical protein HIM_04600 [Hirsutella minnesotensis 3608]|uniref:Cep57 centrosome microtubule-binding domain-containing protein n=1 Tax=Hirsutella minnesotensis 3608 TaxID=1043627 RepID=A0A0F8A5Y6_9HYPO|nr:hypothetical protein HIM_04600 [Hirsutella minnesotensis 3608]